MFLAKVIFNIHLETCLQLVGQDADAARALRHVEGPPDVVGQGQGHGVLDLRYRELRINLQSSNIHHG